MKKAISILMLTCFLSNTAMAECDFSKGITPLADGGFRYTEECHRKVGTLVQDNQTKDRQLSDLTQAIQLKDLALQKSDARVALWMDTSFKMEDRLNKVDELRSKNEWLMFGLGALTVLGAGFMASKLLHP